MQQKRFFVLSAVFWLIFTFSGSNLYTCNTEQVFSQNTEMNQKQLIPGGNCIGVTLATDGVLVVDISDINASGSFLPSPAKKAGLKPGDLIQSFNGTKIETVDDLEGAISASNGTDSKVTLNRDGCTREILIKPVSAAGDKKFKIGAWVKDAASGIGTLTFYDPQTSSFGALGHGICDPDTNEIMKIQSGNILAASIVSVDKGENGVPGELNGIFKESDTSLGAINKNNECGIFGTAEKNVYTSNAAIPIATRSEVVVGPAKILTCIHGDKVEEFSIEISKIMPKSYAVQKGMIIKITDEKLLSQTGGIVRGMSGSPIIQNGKLIGAITHVFINEPARGYGIFIENMLTNITY